MGFEKLETVLDIAITLEVPRNKDELDLRQEVTTAMRQDTATMRILGFGAVEIAEVMSGINSSDFGPDENGLVSRVDRLITEARVSHACDTGDTYKKMPWNQFKKVLGENGFQQVHSHYFESGLGIEQEFGIWAETEFAMLVSAYSCYLCLGSGFLEFEMEAPKFKSGKNKSYGIKAEAQRIRWCYIVQNSSYCKPALKNDKVLGTIFVRDAEELLIQYVNNVRNSGFKLNKPWRFLPMHPLCLLDPVEADYGVKSSEDFIERQSIGRQNEIYRGWHRAMMARSQTLPEHVQEMIGVQYLQNRRQ